MKRILFVLGLLLLAGCTQVAKVDSRCTWQAPADLNEDCSVVYSGIYFDGNDCTRVRGCTEEIPFPINETKVSDYLDACLDDGGSLFECLPKAEQYKQTDVILEDCRNVCLN